MSWNIQWNKLIFSSDVSFDEKCRSVFRFQAKNNPFYKRYLSVFGMNFDSSPDPDEIPLLPIRAFKDAEIITEHEEPAFVFRSSGTSGMERSIHLIADPGLYRKSITKEFYRHFPREHYSLLCYMTGYNENPDSSLIWMSKHLVETDSSGCSSFITAEKQAAGRYIRKIKEKNRIPVLFGAAFGLLDLIDAGISELPPDSHIIETGGMKTYRREMTKSELRQRLAEGFGVEESQIHSEYGMCELLSQMYAIGGEWFTCPHWVRVTIRDPENPSRICEPGEQGKIGLIDLANVYSCAFILTEDRGTKNKDGTFQVLGRWSSADLRGCNFLIDRD
ncbi:MAG: hypothetical protein JJU13_10105 [Balneolaceae bacterium]|nr:hypothetical protein [Balneolaceae bacterium]